MNSTKQRRHFLHPLNLNSAIEISKRSQTLSLNFAQCAFVIKAYIKDRTNKDIQGVLIVNDVSKFEKLFSISAHYFDLVQRERAEELNSWTTKYKTSDIEDKLNDLNISDIEEIKKSMTL